MHVFENLLIKHRQQQEQCRRQIADLESLAERLRADASRLSGDDERLHRLQRSIAEIEGQLVAARNALIEAEMQVRRYEWAQAQRPARRDGSRRGA